MKHLYKDTRGWHAEIMRIEKWAAGALIQHCSKQILEVLVLEGKVAVDGEKLGKCYYWK